MTNKQEALFEIASIAKQHKISLKDIEKALPSTNNTQSSGLLQRLFTYLGGIFLFAGISIFISTNWEYMGLPEQLIITLGAGFVAFIMAVTCLTQKKFEPSATPLFLISAILETTGLGVMLDALSTHQDPHYGIIFISVVMLLQQGLTFIIKKRTVLAFTSIIYLGILNFTLLDMVKVNGEYMAIILGLSLICIGYALNKSQHIALTPFAYFFGSIFFLAGSFELLRHSPIEPIYLGLAGGLIYLSTVIRSRTLLFISCLSMLLYIGDYSYSHFKDSLGWILTLIILGFIMLGMGSFAFKLDRKIKSE